MNTCTQHLLLHTMTSQFLPANVERQKVGLSLGCPSVSISRLHCLNSVLHLLVDPMLVDDQGWMKLTSFHQLFKTLKEVNDTIGTLLVGVRIVYFKRQSNIWSYHLIQCALPPYLSPVGHQWGDLTFDWQVCSILQAALEKEQIQ